MIALAESTYFHKRKYKKLLTSSNRKSHFIWTINPTIIKIYMNIIDTWIFLLEIVNFCGKISISVLYSRQIRK